MKSTIEHPKVFISYAWGSEDYRLKAVSYTHLTLPTTSRV